MSSNTGQKEPTMRDLLQGAGGVLDHPMFVPIIKVAPSPKAADEYVVKHLGWPNSVGQSVRCAARLRERFSATWPQLTESSGRPSDRFIFAPVDDRATRIKVSTGLEVCDVTDDRSHWPLLLREWRFDLGNIPVTTFDETGELRCEEIPCLDCPALYDFQYEKVLRKTGHQGADISTAQRHGGVVVACFKTKHLAIDTKSVMVQGDNHSPFPSFYKVLQVQKRGDQSLIEQIRVLMRQDFGPHMVGRYPNTEFGTVSYQCFADVPDSRVLVELTVHYWIDQELNLKFDLDYCAPIVVRFVYLLGRGPAPITPKNLPADATGATVASLAKVAGAIFSARKPITLERVVGWKSLIEEPPEKLWQLFVDAV